MQTPCSVRLMLCSPPLSPCQALADCLNIRAGHSDKPRPLLVQNISSICCYLWDITLMFAQKRDALDLERQISLLQVRAHRTCLQRALSTGLQCPGHGLPRDNTVVDAGTLLNDSSWCASSWKAARPWFPCLLCGAQCNFADCSGWGSCQSSVACPQFVGSSLQASGERKLRQLSILAGDGSKPFFEDSEPISLTISLHPDEKKSRSYSKSSVASLPPKSL